jgi:hypothetical protein
VTFNGIAASPTSWSNGSITAPVPVGASNGSLVVTVNGFQTNGLTFDIVPNILSLTPASGPVGTTVTIGGNGFGTSQGFGGVTFNGTSATVTNWSDTSISVTVPQGAATGNVVVTASSLLTSAGVPFTVPPTLVSLALSPSNPAIALNSVQQLKLTATGTFSDNSTQDLTASVTWSSSNTSVAMVMPIVGVVGIVGVNKAGTSTITASIGNISSSTLVTVTPAVQPPTPAITGVSTGSGTAGTLVTITGSNFGTQQGEGSVLLGTALGAVTNWTDSQVQATVVAGSTSGVVRIQQNGIWSNSLAFSVSTPTISGITPPSGLSGTSVTITGSGFGSTQGSGQVLLGSIPGVVTNWSDGQVQANVAPGSTSGVVQIIQNGVLSNAIAFTVSIPQITSVTPTSGAAGTSVTISGSGFGTSQGTDGIVWLGSVPGNVVSWSDGQVKATVAANAVSGIVKIHQNGIWSNAFSFTVQPGGTTTLVRIIPNLISMVVGDTRSLQAVDSNGKPITGLTWISSDTTLATLHWQHFQATIRPSSRQSLRVT